MAPYVLRSLWRNRTRTVLTVSGTAVAMLVFCFVDAAREGVDRLGRRARADRTLIVFQANRFCPATSHLPEDYGPTIARVPGVADVLPIQVFTNNCRASLDVIVFHGLPPRRLPAARDLTLLAGDWDRFYQQHDAAVVGRAVAARRRLGVGDKFTIGKVSVTVAGVFAAEQPAAENYIYTHLDFLQRTPGLRAVGRVTQFEVRLAEGADPQAVGAAIDDGFRAGPAPTDTRPQAAFQASSLTDVVEMIGLVQYVGYACVGLVLALVATTTMMAAQDRALEYAVLQTIGFSPPRLFRLVVAESVVMSLAGGLAGVGLAMAALFWSAPAVGAEAVTIALAPSAQLAWSGAAVSGLVGVVAGLSPGWRAARADIPAALRGA